MYRAAIHEAGSPETSGFGQGAGQRPARACLLSVLLHDVQNRVRDVFRVLHAQRRIHRQADLALRERIGFREILRLVAKALGIRAHRVQSNEVYAHADVARFQLFDKLVARNRQALRHNAQHIQMAAVVAVIPKTKDQVDQWRSVMFLYDSALKKLNTKIEILNNEFVNRYDHNPIEHIKSRLKTADSIVKKLKKDGYEVTIENMMDHLSDIAGIRIICSFTSDIYQIADMIAAQGDITVLHVKDYIQNPKPNGYKSYHMVVTVPVYLADGPVQTKVEIQIRSVAMDFWASLEHKIAYKFEGNAPEGLLRELKECADVVDMLDKKMFSLNEAITAYAKEHPETDPNRE